MVVDTCVSVEVSVTYIEYPNSKEEKAEAAV